MIFQNIEFHNVQHIIETEAGWMLSRVPEEVRVTLNDRAREERSFNTCGCELRFNLESEEVRITLSKDKYMPEYPNGICEVYYGSFQAPYGVGVKVVSQQETEIVIKKTDVSQLQELTKQYNLVFDPSLIRVILPYDWITYFVTVVGDVSPPRKEQVPSVRYLSYGSSITHGGDSVRPTGTYAMRTAQKLGVDLLNLGFAGSAHMDEEVANYIARRNDWDFATIEMGINVIRIWDTDFFQKKVENFVSTIAQAHPDKYILCTDLFLCIHDIEQNPKVEKYRSIVRDVVAALESPKVQCVSGKELLLSVEGLSADLVHPSASGHEEIATNISNHFKKLLL